MGFYILPPVIFLHLYLIILCINMILENYSRLILYIPGQIISYTTSTVFPFIVSYSSICNSELSIGIELTVFGKSSVIIIMSSWVKIFLILIHPSYLSNCQCKYYNCVAYSSLYQANSY